MEQKYDSWEEKFNDLQNEYESLSKEKDSWKQKFDSLFSTTSSVSSLNTNKHPHEFWIDIYDKCVRDPDSVKAMVKNKILSIHDQDRQKRTLLQVATCYGSYELVQFCLNAGFDINHKNDDGQTALTLSRDRGYYHIEQLLLFNEMNINIGNEIRNTADTIHKQNGVNYNILNELSLIGEQSKELFENILMELMINIITRRLSFSDSLLNLCWNIASRSNDPLLSDLWQSISSTCSDIIQSGSKRDWYWLKTCIISSTIWYHNIGNDKETRYLYYKLLELVEIESQNQLNKLENDLNILANQNKNDWDKLTTWDIMDEYKTVRQDVIPNGIVSRYTYNQLSESSGAAFNSPKFYDYNQYLSQLVLLAQIVDDEFQKSVQEMFKIDKVTNDGTIKFDNHYNNDAEKKYDDDDDDDNKTGDGKIKYMRGPVKLIERARNKAQNDYANEAYPASACVLDLNRCGLIFNDISTLLAALQLFVNKVKYYQSGNIIGIVRDKNGFMEYLRSSQYADIKLNVLIAGKHNNLIGEVQFLLQTMKDFKDKAHHLYAIQRQQESIETSVSKILPLLLDEDKQLFVAGNRGDINKLCKLMVINNKSIADIMKVDEKNEQSILHRICSMGHYKCFLFLKSILSTSSFIQYILSPNSGDQKPIEYAIRYGQVSIVKNLFDIKQIEENYKDKNELFRLCYFLFVFNKNEHLTDYILNLLNITNENVSEMMNYKYPSPEQQRKAGAHYYHRYTIINRIMVNGTFKTLKKLISIIGEKVFIDNVFLNDDYNQNVLEAAIEEKKVEIVKYILSFKQICDKYINNNNDNNNDNLLFRLIYCLFVECGKIEIIDYVLSQLKISNDTIKSLMNYNYPAPSNRFGRGAYQWQYYSIIGMIAFQGTLQSLKKLVCIIGEKLFYDAVFLRDGWDENAIQAAIQNNKIEIIKYMMNRIDIKNNCCDDKEELFRIITSLNANYKSCLVSYFVNKLGLTDAKLTELNEYRNIDITKILDINNDK